VAGPLIAGAIVYYLATSCAETPCAETPRAEQRPKTNASNVPLVVDRSNSWFCQLYEHQAQLRCRRPVRAWKEGERQRLEEPVLDEQQTAPAAPKVTHVGTISEVCEGAEVYHLTIDVPGIRQADLTLTAHAAHVQTGAAPSVTLKGTTKDRQVDLTVRLPRDANPEHATAEHANGQLKLAVPKIPKRTIPLVVSSPEPAPTSAPSVELPPPPCTPKSAHVPSTPVLQECAPDAANVQAPPEHGIHEPDGDNMPASGTVPPRHQWLDEDDDYSKFSPRPAGATCAQDDVGDDAKQESEDEWEKPDGHS